MIYRTYDKATNHGYTDECYAIVIDEGVFYALDENNEVLYHETLNENIRVDILNN